MFFYVCRMWWQTNKINNTFSLEFLSCFFGFYPSFSRSHFEAAAVAGSGFDPTSVVVLLLLLLLLTTADATADFLLVGADGTAEAAADLLTAFKLELLDKLGAWPLAFLTSEFEAPPPDLGLTPVDLWWDEGLVSLAM